MNSARCIALFVSCRLAVAVPTHGDSSGAEKMVVRKVTGGKNTVSVDADGAITHHEAALTEEAVEVAKKSESSAKHALVTPVWPQAANPGSEWCRDHINQCVENQCCIGFKGSHGKTYPCPKSPYFDRCESNVVPADMITANDLCFPGDSSILVEGRGVQETKGLEVGDRVLADGLSYEPVLSVLHVVEKMYTDAIVADQFNTLAK